MKDADVEMYWAFSKAMTKWKEYAESNKIQRDLETDDDIEARLYKECENIRKRYKKEHKDKIKKQLKGGWL